MLGLYAFFYAALHLAVWTGLDYRFAWGQIAQALAQGRREQIGLLTLLLLVPLAVTSPRSWVARLGKNWQRLHRLVYLAALLDVLHYAMVLRAGQLVAGLAISLR